jgi:cytoskeletal protein RodZ
VTFLNESQQERLKEITANLRHIRQENSISLEQIAMQTHIRLASLQALEEWRFEDLPEPVFIQGFIRRYADKLGLDGTAIAKSFEIDILPIPDNSPNKQSIIYIPLFVPYLALLIAASVGLFYLLKSEFTAKSLDKKEKPILSVQQTTAPSPTSKPISDLTVTLELKDKSKVKINADGKTEFEGILNPGDRKSWQAKTSLTVSSDNAGAVLVSVNQEKPQLLGNTGEFKEVKYMRSQESEVRSKKNN